MIKRGFVYIMASNNNRVLYTGTTSDLAKRVWQHKNHHFHDSFTDKYNCSKLVYFEEGSIEAAIEAEKKFKNLRRAFKDKLICRANPGWDDLSVEFLCHSDADPSAGAECQHDGGVDDPPVILRSPKQPPPSS
jgi:putative endonuclease